jgi:SAM-dependent methyltransferase
MIKVNLACGNKYHKDWINLDFHRKSKFIVKYNLLKKLPFDNSYVDVIYCSHFLEHLAPVQAEQFLNECYRILKYGGIIRIVVPDLENIAEEYLRRLRLAFADNTETNLLMYNMIQLELIDQMVRNKPGGELKNFYQQNRCNKIVGNYILERTGENLESNNTNNKTPIQKTRLVALDKLIHLLLHRYIDLISLLIPKNIRNLIFIKTDIGEKHQWMYDRLSINVLLESIGFKSIEIMDYKTSAIPEFETYGLDVNQDGTPYKGKGSLYCEAIK